MLRPVSDLQSFFLGVPAQGVQGEPAHSVKTSSREPIQGAALHVSTTPTSPVLRVLSPATYFLSLRHWEQRNDSELRIGKDKKSFHWSQRYNGCHSNVGIYEQSGRERGRGLRAPGPASLQRFPVSSRRRLREFLARRAAHAVAPSRRPPLITPTPGGGRGQASLRSFLCCCRPPPAPSRPGSPGQPGEETLTEAGSGTWFAGELTRRAAAGAPRPRTPQPQLRAPTGPRAQHRLSAPRPGPRPAPWEVVEEGAGAGRSARLPFLPIG